MTKIKEEKHVFELRWWVQILNLSKWGIRGTPMRSCPEAIWKETFSNSWSSQERPGRCWERCIKEKRGGREWGNREDSIVIAPYLSKRATGRIKLKQQLWMYWVNQERSHKNKSTTGKNCLGLKEETSVQAERQKTALLLKGLGRWHT